MLDQIIDGRTDLIFDYILQGHAANSTDKNCVPLIKWCAYYGDVSAIRYLLTHNESLTSLGENIGLNNAAFHGHWQLCQYLIENGADVNYALPDTRETPLHASLCKSNRPAYDHIIQILLSHGANPNCITKPSVTTGAFMRDCKTRAETPLHRAAAFGTEQAIQLLLDAGAELDTKDMNGDSPICWASWHLRPAHILKMLCYGDLSIHPDAVKRSYIDKSLSWGGLEYNLLGKPHV